MAAEGILSLSIVEDVLQQHGTRLSDVESRKAEQEAIARYEAAGWLRKMVGVVGAKDFPAQPSEDEFRVGLRSGIILCNVLNKVQPGAVPKVVESPPVSDGAALSAYQYFENVRNFLNVVEEMGLPTFEASDLEQGGESSKIVNCVIALKSYRDSKQSAGNRMCKVGGNLKSTSSGKVVVRKNSELFTNALSRNLSMSEKSVDGLSPVPSLNSDLAHDLTEMTTSPSVNMLVRTVLSDKTPEEVPVLVESMLSMVMEEFERRLAIQNELMKTVVTDPAVSDGYKSLLKTASCEVKEGLDDENAAKMNEEKCLDGKVIHDESKKQIMSGLADGTAAKMNKEKCLDGKIIHDEESKKQTMNGLDDENLAKRNEQKCLDGKVIQDEESKKQIMKQQMHDEESKKQFMKQQMLLDQQQRGIQVLRHTLCATKAGMHSMQRKCLEELNTLGRHMHGLALSASGYQKVLEENRKLYNQVQDLQGNIRVYCRVRPFMPGQPNRLSTVDHIEDGNITIITPSKYGKEGHRLFTFNKVFGPTATQEQVFADTQPLIRSVLDGYNVCIFAYGQTGSGKTHTMSGPEELTEKSQGVNYRALNDLFLLSEKRKNTFRYEISVQMIEIYNEQVRDLLVTDGLNKRLEIRNSSQKGLNVPDANLVPVASTSHVLELMNLGHKNRVVSATALNDRSSRSHSCMTVHVQGKNLTSGAILRGSMHLVDLAGSERVDKSEVTGSSLKEAVHINKSLSALGDVISALAQKNSHVPYRNSKLTQLLQDSLGGQAKTLMFVHISPEPEAVGETISTLKFAERVSSVELGAARVNKDSADGKELKEQIASLKAALARKEGEDMSGGHSNLRQPMEDVGNIEVRKNSAIRAKRRSLDPQELLMNSSQRPPASKLEQNLHKEDEKQTGSEDWEDKVMVNKQELEYGDDKSLGSWDGENGQLPEHFSQKVLPDSKVHLEQLYNRSRFDTATAHDPDGLETATSQSSEPDFLWQCNNPDVTSIPNGVGSKIKKPQPKAHKSPEIRSSIPTLGGSSSSRKVSNGLGPPPTLHRGGSGRQPASVDMKKRRAGNGK